MQAGRHESAGGNSASGGRRAYETTYAREKGVWKIKVLNYRPVWHADFRFRPGPRRTELRPF